MNSPKLSPAHKALIRRYLVWNYKSTKESFDRLERKTTQLLADDFILKEILFKKIPREGAVEYKALVDGFKGYIKTKKEQPIDQGKRAYLSARLDAVSSAIRFYLGAKALNEIRADYESEFTRRIWEAKEH